MCDYINYCDKESNQEKKKKKPHHHGKHQEQKTQHASHFVVQLCMLFYKLPNLENRKQTTKSRDIQKIRTTGRRQMWFGSKACVYGQRQLDIKMTMGARRPRNTFMLKPFQKHLIQIENRKQTTKSRKQKTNRQIKKIYRRRAQQDENRCGSVRKPMSTDEERH